MTSYAIRGGEEGKRRLDLLAQTLGPATEMLLEKIGVGVGMRCLDVGCGCGHVSASLARLVGESGRVVGLDLDTVKLTAATETCREAGLMNVEFRAESVIDWQEPESYDVAYGRFILSHLSTRRDLVRTMSDALKPGGTLVVEDIDFDGCFSHPPNAAFARYCTLYREVVRRRGGDADLGPHLYQYCLDAGLEDVCVQIVHLCHADGPSKRLALSTLVNISDAVIDEGLASRDELDETIDALAAFTDDPRSIIGLPRVFQVWGRRSSAPAADPRE